MGKWGMGMGQGQSGWAFVAQESVNLARPVHNRGIVKSIVFTYLSLVDIVLSGRHIPS
jgi:hypothetical protein